MKYLTLIAAFLLTLSLSAVLVGCEEQGPAERMGEGIDEAAEEMRDAVEDVRDRNR